MFNEASVDYAFHIIRREYPSKRLALLVLSL